MVLDPREGVARDGTIRTGVDRRRTPSVFEPVVTALLRAASTDAPAPAPESAAAPASTPALAAARQQVSLLLYGSVATGAARSPHSDVDALTVGLPPAGAAAISRDLSRRFAAVCRGVQVGAGQHEDFAGEGDEAYGNRVFLRHYCVVLAGPDLARSWGPFPADVRAARGFNGDIEAHHQRWQRELDDGEPAGSAPGRGAEELGRRVARKTLLALAGLVSVRERRWTTDRGTAARRWSQLEPSVAEDVQELVRWSQRLEVPQPPRLRRALDDDGVVGRTVRHFRDEVGLWDSTGPS